MSSRADRLGDRLLEEELDWIVVSNLVNVRYLTGFTGTNGVALVSPADRVFLTDFRYVEQAAEQVEGFESVRGKQNLLEDVAERVSGRVGFEDQHLSVRAHGRLVETAGEGVELVPAGGWVEDLREVKDEGELSKIRAAAALGDEMFEYLCERGLAGRTEREVALDLEREMRERGAEDPSFPAIVASGAHGALPHAEPRDVEIPPGELVIVDMGARLDGYCSDCTRTLASGSVSGEAQEVYDLVLDAQQESLAAVRAGASCRAVDAVARERIDAAGHKDHFGHGLGHGVGLEVHEAPRLSPAAPEEAELEEANVVSVEPGVYLPGRLGVRIEDLVAVTGDGAEVLSRFPKELRVLS